MALVEYARAMKANVLIAYKFIGYFDESEDSDILCLAGVFAPAQHWAPFEDAWLAIVNDVGMPEFHMQECENRKGFWEAWTDPSERQAVQQRFIDLFVDNPHPSPAAFAVGVDLAAFTKTVEPKIKSVHPRQGLDKPWIFALVHLLDRMVTVQRLSNKTLGTDERLGLFFDEKDEFAGRVGEMVRAIKRNLMDYPLGDVAFDDSRNQPALQAADLLAYEARRSMTEVVLPTDPSKEVRDQWWQLMHATLPSGGRRIWADYWDAEALLRNVNDVSLDEDDGPQSIPAETADTAVRWLTGRGSGSP